MPATKTVKSLGSAKALPNEAFKDLPIEDLLEAVCAMEQNHDVRFSSTERLFYDKTVDPPTPIGYSLNLTIGATKDVEQKPRTAHRPPAPARAEVNQFLDDEPQLYRPLGAIIEALEKHLPENIVYFDFEDVLPTSELRSYRGYYQDLALGYGGPLDITPLKVEDLLEVLKKGIGGTFTGYKGGEYCMDKNTRLWASNWGEVSGREVIGVRSGKSSKSTVLVTCKAEDD